MPWPWRRSKHDDHRTTEDAESGERFDLYDLELTEVSIVDAGDNPGAHLLLTKQRDGGSATPVQQGEAPDTGEQGAEWLTEDAIQELIDEELAAGDGAGVGKTTDRRESMQHLQKRSDVAAEVGSRARALIEQRKAAGDDELTIAQARMEIWLTNEALRERYSELLVETREKAPVAMRALNSSRWTSAARLSRNTGPPSRSLRSLTRTSRRASYG